VRYKRPGDANNPEELCRLKYTLRRPPGSTPIDTGSERYHYLELPTRARLVKGEPSHADQRQVRSPEAADNDAPGRAPALLLQKRANPRRVRSPVMD